MMVLGWATVRTRMLVWLIRLPATVPPASRTTDCAGMGGGTVLMLKLSVKFGATLWKRSAAESTIWCAPSASGLEASAANWLSVRERLPLELSWLCKLTEAEPSSVKVKLDRPLGSD